MLSRMIIPKVLTVIELFTGTLESISATHLPKTDVVEHKLLISLTKFPVLQLSIEHPAQQLR